MTETDRIYLDNAATSFPKPEMVDAAVSHYSRNLGVAVGRGAYRQAVEVQQVVEQCRKRAADLLGAESPERIVFTFNGTDSLNLALHGLLEPGDHVVTSVVEHNSVLRPLRELESRRQVEVTRVAADDSGLVEPVDVRNALRPNTRLVALIHASNVSGTLQPISDCGDIAHAAGALFLVDAAQSAGHVPINLRDLPIDLLACPGHKGLLGPLGTGLLYLRPGVDEQVHSLRQGGTGSQSEQDRQPETLPDKYESGNHNAPGLFGLEAALAWLEDRGIESIRDHERQLTRHMLESLSGVNGVRLPGPASAEDRVGVVSMTADGFEPQILSAVLDESFHIQTRAGLHCAPGVHRCLGTFSGGGTVRFSFGPFTTIDEIDAATAAITEIVGSD